MLFFLEDTLLPKMSEKDKREAERDDITEVDQERSFQAHAQSAL